VLRGYLWLSYQENIATTNTLWYNKSQRNYSIVCKRELVAAMPHYVVQIWKTKNRIAVNDADYNEIIDASTEVDAAKKILEIKHISEKFYIEVRFKGNNIDCWRFTDLSPEMNF
jgi:effector-binding domain-containing protein